jgi:hypothetical protein
MTMTFWIITGIAALAFFVAPNWKKIFRSVEEKTAQMRKVKFFDGPLNGSVQEVSDDSPWYTFPYLPDDQDEWEEDESRKPVEGMRYIKPHWAYYQQIEDENYFYVRDIREDEMMELHQDGKLPSPVAKDE